MRARLTLFASVTMTLASIAVGVLFTLALRGRAEEYQREQITAAAFRVIPHIASRDLPPVLPRHGVEGIQVVDPRGRVVSATPELLGRPRMAYFVPDRANVRAIRTTCSSPALSGCVVIAVFRVYEPEGEWLVYTGDHAVPWYISGRLVAAELAAYAVLLLITLFGTYRTISRTLAPVTEIRRQLAEITATDPGRRLPLPKQRDELRRLVETANATLDRLEASMEQLRRFSSDASHDLRSPMTAMRAQVEEALLHPDDTDWPQIANSVLDSIDHLEAIVTDLLTLARLDAGVHRGSDTIDLADLVTTELDRRARRVRVTPHLEPNVIVTGDRLRLARLLTNLVDNAERHADSRIDITVRAERGAAVLEVQDDGEGIAPKDREAVFQRFVRLADARRRDAGGTGLGLPIARQIAEAHGGTLTIEDSPRGALFRLCIPTA